MLAVSSTAAESWSERHCTTNFTGSTRPGVFQAGSDSSPVSERLRTAVGLLCSGRRCRQSAAPVFCQPSTACSTSLPAQHFSVAGPQSLELSPRFYPGPDNQCRLFQTFAENVPVRSILVHLAR